MSKVYLRASTILYHEHLARDGQLFAGSEANPLPHPGEGWVDTPAKFSDAPAPVVSLGEVLEAQRTNALTQDHFDRLRERVADADRLIEIAEKGRTEAEEALRQEREDHAKTRQTAEEQGAALRNAAGEIAALKAKADEVGPLTEALTQAQADNAQLAEQLAAAKAEAGGAPKGEAKKG